MAVAVRLDRTQFGDARIADPTVRDRPARTAISITIRDRARADDGAGGERPCHRGVRKQPAEIEGHVDACVRFAEGLAIDERQRSEEHTSELQSLMRISYAVFCLKKKNKKQHEKSTRT